MSDPHVQKSPVTAAAAAVGDYADRARRWSATHVPGGQKTLWVVLGLLAVVLLIVVIRHNTTAQTNTGRLGAGGPTSVGVATVVASDVKITLDALGTVTPLATVTIKPQVTGTLNKIDFQEGQMVSAGQVIAEIDPRPFQAALDQAKGQLERDAATLANAKVDLARYQALHTENAISDQIYATAAATVRTDTGTVVADKAAVEAAAVNLSYCKITAPIAGRIGIRQVDVGNLVQAGGTTAIVVITQLQPVSVLFSVPEDSIGDIMSGVNKGVTLTATAYDRAQTTKLATGTLSVVDNQIDPTTGTVKLRAMFDNSANELFPQQFVNIRLLVNTLHNQTNVPAAAIQRGASGAYVFAVNPDNTVSMRSVTLGPADGDNVAILNGLNPGQTVVVDGADRLNDGAAVSLPGAKPAAAGTQPGTASGQHGKGHGHHHRHGQSGQSSGGSGGGP